MKLSEISEELAAAGNDEVVRLYKDVSVDSEFRSGRGLPPGWLGLVEDSGGVRALDGSGVLKRQNLLHAYRPACHPGLDPSDWRVEFFVHGEQPVDEADGREVGVRCRAALRLADPRPLAQAYPRDDGVWGVSELERLLANILAPEIAADVLSGRIGVRLEDGDAKEAAVHGQYVVELLARLDHLLLGAGIAIGGMKMSLEAWPPDTLHAADGSSRGSQAGGERRSSDVGRDWVGSRPAVLCSRSGAASEADDEVRLLALESRIPALRAEIRGPDLLKRAQARGTFERVRRIRELIALELQGSMTIVSQWSQAGDVKLTEEALKLVQGLDSTIYSLRTVQPERRPGHPESTRSERQRWFEKYESDYALAHRMRRRLEEVDERFVVSGRQPQDLIAELPLFAVMAERLARSLALPG